MNAPEPAFISTGIGISEGPCARAGGEPMDKRERSRHAKRADAEWKNLERVFIMMSVVSAFVKYSNL
jgi:hypothetical protein